MRDEKAREVIGYMYNILLKLAEKSCTKDPEIYELLHKVRDIITEET